MSHNETRVTEDVMSKGHDPTLTLSRLNSIIEKGYLRGCYIQAACSEELGGETVNTDVDVPIATLALIDKCMNNQVKESWLLIFQAISESAGATLCVRSMSRFRELYFGFESILGKKPTFDMLKKDKQCQEFILNASNYLSLIPTSRSSFNAASIPYYDLDFTKQYDSNDLLIVDNEGQHLKLLKWFEADILKEGKYGKPGVWNRERVTGWNLAVSISGRHFDRSLFLFTLLWEWDRIDKAFAVSYDSNYPTREMSKTILAKLYTHIQIYEWFAKFCGSAGLKTSEFMFHVCGLMRACSFQEDKISKWENELEAKTFAKSRDWAILQCKYDLMITDNTIIIPLAGLGPDGDDAVNDMSVYGSEKGVNHFFEVATRIDKKLFDDPYKERCKSIYQDLEKKYTTAGANLSFMIDRLRDEHKVKPVDFIALSKRQESKSKTNTPSIPHQKKPRQTTYPPGKKLRNAPLPTINKINEGGNQVQRKKPTSSGRKHIVDHDDDEGELDQFFIKPQAVAKKHKHYSIILSDDDADFLLPPKECPKMVIGAGVLNISQEDIDFFS